MKILLISSYAPEVLTFRGDMILEMKQRGHEVLVAAPEPEVEALELKEKLKIKYRQIYMNRTGKNPFQDMKTLIQLIKLINKEKPDSILTYTIKPVIYGSIAARVFGLENNYAMMSGLGSISRGQGVKNSILKLIINTQYKIGLKGCKRVFFQNKDDRDEFIKRGLINKDKVVLINGSGVNLDRFSIEELPKSNTFIFIGRLLKDKGILEYFEAAKIVKNKYPNSHFRVLGGIDTNPSVISEEILKEYVEGGYIEYLGVTKDVRPYLKESRIFVLPSYHEGTSRAALEAMAMGRPIITTDAPGCRETVIDGVNGFLVPIRDTNKLAEKMIWMIENEEKVEKMGKESRRICEEKFDVNKVNEVILTTMGLCNNLVEKKV